MSSHIFDPSILRAYDIRGIYGKTLTIRDAEAIGLAFGTDLTGRGGRSACVAYDVRLSSPLLEQALIRGLISTGIDVTQVGMGPSPMLYFAQKYLKTDAGLIITGSHNPADYNGIKICLKTGPFFGEDIKRLGELAQEGAFIKGQGRLDQKKVLGPYVDTLVKDFDLHYSAGRPLKVVWDPANGATCPVLEKLLPRLPGEHSVINPEADGRFPAHHPDPCIEKNMQFLSQMVVQQEADLGIGLDGDGDRIGIVDNKGRLWLGDQLLAFFAEEVAETNPGAIVLADVKSSKVLFDHLASLGLQGQMVAAGHSNIKALMTSLKSPLAGEMSGHMFFADRYFGYDDALYAALRVIGALSLRQDSLAQWLDCLPKTFITPERWHVCEDARKFEIVETVKRNLQREGIEFIDADGVRVSTDDGWWLLRASNTQAVLVTRAEGQTPEGLARMIQSLNTYLHRVGVEG